ncbi:MAG: DUF4402 domain-containing protein [Candidatus Marinimicrobia bacterium]|nr:DUF4402 domain-containing protein [Candidatus Neomarinimicrobiota bacterium]MCF7922829.1 DUF4402 domain-containing protein [Candidatus Neomarinimicrobiota bacterium]
MEQATKKFKKTTKNMKKGSTMKKVTMILAIMIFAMAGTSVYAGDQAAASVEAVVQANLSLTAVDSVNFGTLQPTSTPIIDPTGSSHTDVTSPTVGSFDLTGANDQVVTITEGGNVTLGDGNSHTMTFTPDLFGKASDDASTSSAVGGTVTLSATGTYFFWLGGDLGTLTNQVAGSYSSEVGSGGSGSWTLDVEYQ